MTIKECIDIVDNLKPNQYTMKEKVSWLSFIDEIIINEVLKTHEGYDGRYDDFEGYSEDKLSVVLIVPSPYDRLYTAYLKMKIDGENGETARYNNSAALYNTYMLEFRKHYNKTHMPLDPSAKKIHSPSPSSKIGPGLTDAEYENLKRDMTYILTEYFSDAVSDDKLNDAVTKYASNNLDMIKGKDGYTPKKGTDYFTEEEVNEIHSMCEEKISNSVKNISGKLEEYVNRTCATKEDKANKVDAFGDATDKFKAYPSVFGVEAAFDEFKSKMLYENIYPITDGKAERSELPTKLSDLKDDSPATMGIALAKKALGAERDVNNNPIHTTYATKTEVVKDLGIIPSSELDKITEPGIYGYTIDGWGYRILMVDANGDDDIGYFTVQNTLYPDGNVFMSRTAVVVKGDPIHWSTWASIGKLIDSETAKMPTQISDLSDDTANHPIEQAVLSELSMHAQMADNASYADSAWADCFGNEFTTTYALKSEVVEEAAKKLDREWTKLGSDSITDEDTDLKALTAVFERDISNCVELMAIIRIPMSGNNTNANWSTGLIAPGESEPHYGKGWLTTPYGGLMIKSFDDNGKLSENEVMVRSYFMDGINIYTQSAVSTTSSLKQSTCETVPRQYEGTMANNYGPATTENKDAYYFEISGDFLLPTGTTLTVYGR